MVSEHCIDEAKRVFYRKFPQKINAFDSFLGKMLMVVKLIETPVEKIELENSIRDINDRPIFRAAIKAKAKLILTGDKDFLEASITNPQMISSAEFLLFKEPD